MVKTSKIDLNIMIKNYSCFNKNKVILGKKTELKCRCGEYLYEYNPAKYYISKIIGNPRYSKKSRLRKKFYKQWKNKNFGLLLTMPLRRNSFYCQACNQAQGFYQAIANNLIQIEPMPKGAVFYTKE